MKLSLSLTIFFTVVLSTQLCKGQSSIIIKRVSLNNTDNKDTLFITKDTSLTPKDISDVIAQLLHHKIIRVIDSITSRPTVSVAPAIGYTLLTKFALVVSGNMAFRMAPQSRISTIVASTSYTQNKQFTLPIQTNIWNRDNSFNFIGEYDFYKYPQNTYGLGSSSDIKDKDPMDYYYFKFSQTALRRLTGNLYAGAGYILDTRWDISDKGNLNGTLSDYSVYGKRSYSTASGLTFNVLFDSRDNGINPAKGSYATLQYRDNLTQFGSTNPWRSIIFEVRKYYKFPEGSDNVLALWSYNWFVLSGKPAYLDLPSTQWDSNSATGRGYIQGRFRGAQMIYLEGEYRFRVTGNGLLGGVVFLNGESLSAAPGTHLQSIQPGFGPGLRIKINKTSKTNITIDYGFGRQGSKGLFIDVGEAF